MFDLLIKEVRLAAHPNLFIFTALGVLVIVPAYPYGMVFLFGCLAPFITFMYGRETNDIFYTALLPVKKRDVVKAKFMLVILAQMTQLVITLPLAFLRVRLIPDGNPAGIEVNVAYYGFGLITYAVFNFIFLTYFFKSAHKVGTAFLFGIVPATFVVLVMEVIVHIPGFTWLDRLDADVMVRQLPILIAGAVVYIVLMMIANKVSAKRFEQVDL